MAKEKVLVLGCTGMLGSMVLDVLYSEKKFDLGASLREESLLKNQEKKYSEASFILLDAEKDDEEAEEALAEKIKGYGWVINAIGVIKPYIHDDNPQETERALRINSLFPHLLGKAAEKQGVKVLQIATDCVYSGTKGHYTEKDAQDALDVYGKTKSLGETYLPSVSHLRCSIIGPEMKGHVSLLDWFLGQAQGAQVNGYTNHQWNGVTTFHFAKLCTGIITKNIELGHLQHVMPEGEIAKADMLKAFAKYYKRQDININSVPAEKVVDRTLSTNDPDKNKQVWQASGYTKIPTVVEMIKEMAEWK